MYIYIYVYIYMYIYIYIVCYMIYYYNIIMLCAVELNVVIYMRKEMREVLMDTLDICNKMWAK